ncbi:UNVERIFIED_ORG: serine/threonine protein kinase [Microbispora rosea subsp. rosea]
MAEVESLLSDDPRQVGSYTLVGRLGEGGQGVVYLGQATNGPHVAIKLLHSRDEKTRKRFLREAATAQKVARFCVAQIIEVGVMGDRPYIVSEYINGNSLQNEVTKNGPRAGADLDRLAISTITALAAIHGAGIVHRDFKPANVLLAPDGPRVIDFGIARAMDGVTPITSHLIGTPAFMAPELMSDGPISPAADIFSWGVTMVFAATGQTAFGGRSIPAIMNRILTAEPDLGTTDQLSDPLRSIILATLSKSPGERPSAPEILHALMDPSNFRVKANSTRGEHPGNNKAEETASTKTTKLDTPKPSRTASTEINQSLEASDSASGHSFLGFLLIFLGLIVAVGGIIAVMALTPIGRNLLDHDSRSIAAPSSSVSTRASAAPKNRPTRPKLRTPHLFVISNQPLPDSAIRKVRRLSGIQAVEAVGAADIIMDGRQVHALGVDPWTFRAFMPQVTAESDGLWQSVAAGDFAVSFRLSEGGFTLGRTVSSGGRQFKIGAAAEIALPIDILVSPETSRTLGIPAQNALLISAPNANIDLLRTRLLGSLPSGTDVVVLRAT